ncbi:potassium-transporting ATPase KdpC subunit [Cytophagales bacterium WSM2-2]|nr:potassium-transporting ATPase KdpC subunit [Cytophagales bacterium WSM2-2]
MKTNLFPAIKLTLLCIVFFVVIYSLIVWSVAYVTAPNHGRGEVVMNDGKVVGFAIVGQTFNQDKYFWSRPSAVNYNASGSAGSNKGPSNEEYLQAVQARIDTFLIHNPDVKKSQIPVELVTASGSGLDPHISPAAAYVQIKRIAKVRNLDEAKLKSLVDVAVEKPLMGLFGIEKINVLKLNIELTKLK